MKKHDFHRIYSRMLLPVWTVFLLIGTLDWSWSSYSGSVYFSWTIAFAWIVLIPMIGAVSGLLLERKWGFVLNRIQIVLNFLFTGGITVFTAVSYIDWNWMMMFFSVAEFVMVGACHFLLWRYYTKRERGEE